MYYKARLDCLYFKLFLLHKPMTVDSTELSLGHGQFPSNEVSYVNRMRCFLCDEFEFMFTLMRHAISVVIEGLREIVYQLMIKCHHFMTLDAIQFF